MNKLLILAAIATTGYAGVRLLSSEPRARDTEQLALDRLWIDHMPRTETDTIQAFVALTEEPVGVFQAASMWKGQHELFVHEHHGNELRIRYPQNNEREKVKLEARRCDAKGWDYCLEIKGSSRGVKRYYSMEGWELDGARGVDQVRARITELTRARVD